MDSGISGALCKAAAQRQAVGGRADGLLKRDSTMTALDETQKLSQSESSAGKTSSRDRAWIRRRYLYMLSQVLIEVG